MRWCAYTWRAHTNHPLLMWAIHTKGLVQRTTTCIHSHYYYYVTCVGSVDLFTYACVILLNAYSMRCWLYVLGLRDTRNSLSSKQAKQKKRWKRNVVVLNSTCQPDSSQFAYVHSFAFELINRPNTLEWRREIVLLLNSMRPYAR